MPGQHEGFPAGTHRIAAPMYPRAWQADLEKTISFHCQELKNDSSVIHPVAQSLYQLSYPGYCKFKDAFKILTLADFHPCWSIPASVHLEMFRPHALHISMRSCRAYKAFEHGNGWMRDALQIRYSEFKVWQQLELISIQHSYSDNFLMALNGVTA